MSPPYYPHSGTVVRAIPVGLGFHYEKTTQSEQQPHCCWQFNVYKVLSIEDKVYLEKTFGISAAHQNVHIPSVIEDMHKTFLKIKSLGRLMLITQQNPFIIIEDYFFEELRTILEKKCRLFAWNWIMTNRVL